jgi:ectoine hydroxylase-related dioxygenase (phytanoyl-CoA dioxygenase family)
MEETMAVLSVEQKRFWDDNGYLIWDRPLLSAEQLQALAERLTDIARGRLTHVPEEMFRFEQTGEAGADAEEARYNRVRTIAFLHKYDDLVRAICQSPTILDIVEDLLGPNIKLYTDQFFMKPPFHGTAQVWHQDSETWTFFAPHDHVTCWIAIDEATEENGCLHYLAGSHVWGYVDTAHLPNLREQLKDSDVSVPRKPGYGVFHHSLTLHQTGPNTTPNRRRGIALHYIRAETRYIGNPGDRQPPFLLMRGQELPGRV